MFGCGAVAQLILSGGSHGMFLTVNFAFGFAATLGILVCGQVSGNIEYCLLFLKTVRFVFPLGEHRKFQISEVAFQCSESLTAQNQILKREGFQPNIHQMDLNWQNYTTFFSTFRTFYFQKLLGGIKGWFTVKVHSDGWTVPGTFSSIIDVKPSQYQTTSSGSFDFNISNEGIKRVFGL